jgi:hypothetical protein
MREQRSQSRRGRTYLEALHYELMCTRYKFDIIIMIELLSRQLADLSRRVSAYLHNVCAE